MDTITHEPHLRVLPGTTLTDVRDQMDKQPGKVDTIDQPKIRFNLAKGEIALKPRVIVPATTQTEEAFSEWARMPTAWLMKQPLELRQHAFTSVFNAMEGPAAIRHDDETIYDIVDPSRMVVDPRAMVEVLQKVLGPKATIVDFRLTPADLWLDTIVARETGKGVGGDRPTARRVGDITKAGIRLVQNRKRNLAPDVQRLLYRLVCTNGMEVRENGGTQIELRGHTVPEVLAQLEKRANELMADADVRIKSFYDLRDEPIEGDLGRAITQMGREHGVASNIVASMVDLAPSLPDPTTRFDLVNLFTNTANEPSVRRKEKSSRSLEQAGGNVVEHAHVDRCSRCQRAL